MRYVVHYCYQTHFFKITNIYYLKLILIFWFVLVYLILKNDSKKITTVKYGHLDLTQHFFLGSASATHLIGIPGYVNLPWSCAMYSVVNWMVAFTQVKYSRIQ